MLAGVERTKERQVPIWVNFGMDCSGQIIATLHDLTQKCSWGREIPLFQGNVGWWSLIIWPDCWLLKDPRKTMRKVNFHLKVPFFWMMVGGRIAWGLRQQNHSKMMRKYRHFTCWMTLQRCFNWWNGFKVEICLSGGTESCFVLRKTMIWWVFCNRNTFTV